MIKSRKIGTNTEYSESIRHTCGHVIEYTTLNYKMTRKQTKQKRFTDCLRCQLTDILSAHQGARG